MKKIILLFFLSAYFIPSRGQLDDVNKLKTKILDFKDNISLETFLVTNDLITPPMKTDSPAFHAGNIKVTILEKNLFGDSLPEYILQLTENTNPLSYSINFFYSDTKKIKKVPSQIYNNANNFMKGEIEGGGISLEFIDIFKPEQYCLLLNDEANYFRKYNTVVLIYLIKPNQIWPLYSFTPAHSSYSGILTYENSENATYKFQLLNNTYPKVLRIDETFRHETAEARNSSNDDIISGEVSYGTREKLVSFNETEYSKDSIIKENIIKSIYLNSFHDIENLQYQTNKCDSNITLFITDRFLYTYLADTNQVKGIHVGIDSTQYLECCNAYIRDRFLFTESRDSATNKIKISKYDLKPPFYSLLKNEINLKRFYYFEDKEFATYRDTLIYFDKDTTFKYPVTNAVNLGEPRLIYDVWYYKEFKLEVSSSEWIWFVISLDRMAPYLKPEALEMLKKTKKKF